MKNDNEVKYKNDYAFAVQMDGEDPLKTYRRQFHLPKQKTGKPFVYLCGNSLGLQPVSTKDFLNQELEDWANLGVEGHFNAKNPWMPYHEFLTEGMAKIVGAKPTEVVTMNTLTVNLHLMMVSFYRPTKERYKIVIEENAFPSDQYAVASQAKFHGLDPQEAIIELKPREGEDAIRTEDIEALFSREGDKIALIMLGGVNYYSGQVFDMQKIAATAHTYGSFVGFDLAHAAGNIEMNLHDYGVDFAVWCTYKYLNSGPGSVAGCFVHEKHALNFDGPRFTGWWGCNKSARFAMKKDYDPIPTAEAWQLSNPPILSLAAIRASVKIFDKVGMGALRKKSLLLTGYLEFLLNELNNSFIKIITPKDINQRGCQLSIQVRNGDKKLFDQITAKGVIADWREPDVIRVAPAPLYNSFEDVFSFVEIFKGCLNNQ